MGGSSSKQTVENITSNISKSILNALQKSQTSATLRQQVSGKCDTDVIKSISEAYTSCIIDFVDDLTPDDLLDACSLYTSICTMSDIDLSANLNIDTLTNQNAKVIQEIKTDIGNTLSQYGGSKTDQYIKNITDNVTEVVAEVVQKLKNDKNAQQTIDLNAVQGKFISMKSSLKSISKTIQDNSVMSKNITAIDNIISQTSFNESSIFKTVLYITILIIVTGFLISTVMTLQRSTSLTDFFYRILPVLIYFVLVAIITIIHYLAKPGYVSFYDKKGKKILDNKKLFLYLMLYYIILGVIIFVITRLISNFKKK